MFGQFSTTKTSLASKYWLVLRMTVVISARIKLTGFPFQVLPLLVFVVEVIIFFNMSNSTRNKVTLTPSKKLSKFYNVLIGFQLIFTN